MTRMSFSSCLSWCVVLSIFSVNWKVDSFALLAKQPLEAIARCSPGRPFVGGIQMHAIGDDIERERKGIPRISTVTSMDDFFKVLAEDERLTIIKFHASWCKSCQKFGLKFKKLAHEYGDTMDRNGNIIEQGPIRFAEIEFTANANLCRTLEVKRLPYIHIYRGAEGLLSEFACGPKRFHLLTEAVEKYMGETGPTEAEQFDNLMEAGDGLGREIAADLQPVMSTTADVTNA